MGILSDISSILPATQGSALAKFPTAGSAAPALHNLPTSVKGSIRVFMRHCGCPMAEQTLVALVGLAEQHPGISFHVVTTANDAAMDAWIASIPNLPSPIPSNIELHPCSDLSLYAEHGLALSGLLSIFNPTTIRAAWSLRQKGILNRETVGTRYPRAGVFAVDEEGSVTWAWHAYSADQTSDLEKAVSTLASLA